MTYKCGSPVPGWEAVLSEKETCSYLYIFAHDPSLLAITNSSPKSNELLERFGPTCNTSCFFLTLGNQARSPYPLTYHCARPLGAVRGCIRHGGRTEASGTLQLGREKKRSAPGPRLR